MPLEAIRRRAGSIRMKVHLLKAVDAALTPPILCTPLARDGRASDQRPSRRQSVAIMKALNGGPMALGGHSTWLDMEEPSDDVPSAGISFDLRPKARARLPRGVEAVADVSVSIKRW